jgi:hypothetical protein
MKFKLVVGLAILTICTSCTTETVRREVFGKFILTTRLTVDKLKWEGGNSQLNYAEICRDDGELCFRGDDDLDYFYSRRHGRLSVNNTKAIKLFNTVNGEPIDCDLHKLEDRLLNAVGGYWSNEALIVFTWKKFDGKYDEQTDIFSFKKGSCVAIKSFDSTYEKRLYRTQESESGAISWAACNQTNCTLKWLEPDFLTAHQKEIGCNENSNLDIIWINGTPEPRNRNGPKNQYCLNEAGELKYPFTPPGSYVPDDAPDARY